MVINKKINGIPIKTALRLPTNDVKIVDKYTQPMINIELYNTL